MAPEGTAAIITRISRVMTGTGSTVANPYTESGIIINASGIVIARYKYISLIFTGLIINPIVIATSSSNPLLKYAKKALKKSVISRLDTGGICDATNPAINERNMGVRKKAFRL